MLAELVALANSGAGEFIRKVGGSFVNATLASTISFDGLSDVVITAAAGGDIIYFDGANFVNLHAGVAGEILSSNGPGASPTWAPLGSGTVTSVSVVTANGVSGVVATPNTTPAITLTLGDITPSSVVSTGVVQPSANDGAALGVSGTAWADLFLASGGVIDWNAGAATLTHGANLLTLGGSGAVTLALGTNSITMTGSLGLTGARLTKGWFTDLEVTNAIAGSITGNAATATTAVLASTVTVADAAADASMFVVLAGAATGSLAMLTDPGLSYDANTNVLTSGALAIAGTGGAGYITLVAQASNPTSPAAGTLLLHSSTTNGFTRMEQDNEAATNLIIGRDNVFIAKNTSGSPMTKGQVVYITGSTGNVPNIGLAKSNSITTMSAVGILLDNIADNAFGQVMYTGLLTSFNTSAFSVGDQLFVDATTAGALTATRPSGTTNIVQHIGVVTVDSVGSGAIVVKVAPALQNAETGTNAATWTGTTVAVTTIELGAGATDTTLSRVSAGVVAIEGINILTVAGGSLTGNLTFGENVAIAFDPSLSADGKYNGTTITGTAGAALAFGDLITFDKDDQRWELVDISVAAAATGDARGILGICVLAAAGDGSATTILLHGTVRADTNFPALTQGAPVYASTTGDIVVAQPTTTDHVIRIIGFAILDDGGATSQTIYFNPDNSYITHT